jgi:hypothetical protein
MKFLPLIGKRLKDDVVMELLDYCNIDVVYAFDRMHENTPDKYFAASKEGGFEMEFTADQILDAVFLHVTPAGGFNPVKSEECDMPFFSSAEEVERFGAEKNLQMAKGGPVEFLGVQRKWVRLEFETHCLHYEFQDAGLALITISRRK